MNPAVVSLKGYANVNRELLTAVMPEIFQNDIHIYEYIYLFQCITTIAIYLIVLLQFKLSLIAQQLPPSLMSIMNDKKLAGI